MEIAQSPSIANGLPAWTPDEFERQLRAKGTSYHIHHPFNVRMNSGGCTAEEIRCWVANRFYYQICIPRKDAAILEVGCSAGPLLATVNPLDDAIAPFAPAMASVPVVTVVAPA